MADKKSKKVGRPLLDLMMRLLCVYLAASFFFGGLQYWRDGELLLAASNFAIVIGEIGLILNWSGKSSKFLRILMLGSAAAALIFFSLSKILN